MKNITPKLKGARAEFLATHPKEQAIQTATIKTICHRIGKFRKDAEKWGNATVKLANDARDIGIFIKEFADSLPGKQLTLDFWQQFDGMFVDQFGQKITRDQLKLFVRIADNTPEAVTDIQLAMSWRQQLLLAAGFELIGETTGTTAHETNYYDKFLSLLDVKKIDATLKGLENDPHFGAVETWPAERRERVWLQIEPLVRRVDELAAKLKPGE